MVKENLLNYVNIPPENVHPIATDQRNVDLAAEQFKNELVSFFDFAKNNAPRFDLILLGIGTDGHTASLFPDDERVDDPDRLVLPVSLPHLKRERVSLTLPVINNARHVIVLAAGASKAEVVCSPVASSTSSSRFSGELLIWPAISIRPSVAPAIADRMTTTSLPWS